MKTRIILISLAIASIGLSQTPTPAPTPPLWSVSALSVSTVALPIAPKTSVLVKIQALKVLQIFNSKTISDTEKWIQIKQLVWSNPSGVAAQDICDALGSNAVALVNAWGAYITYLYTVDSTAASQSLNAPAIMTVLTSGTTVATSYGATAQRWVILTNGTVTGTSSYLP